MFTPALSGPAARLGWAQDPAPGCRGCCRGEHSCPRGLARGIRLWPTLGFSLIPSSICTVLSRRAWLAGHTCNEFRESSRRQRLSRRSPAAAASPPDPCTQNSSFLSKIHLPPPSPAPSLQYVPGEALGSRGNRGKEVSLQCFTTHLAHGQQLPSPDATSPRVLHVF